MLRALVLGTALLIALSAPGEAAVARAEQGGTPSTTGPQAMPAATNLISGIVKDAAGGAVIGATVVARSASGAEIETVTGADGRFVVLAPSAGDTTLVVRARGFADSRTTLAASATRDNVQLALTTATMAETVTVTSTRSEQELGEVAASVTVLDRTAIRQSPASTADDLLRQVPTFSLFRRLSSLAAHPTAQGVSLRGIGPSGVSRTLVLLDGVPFNDPFGGWVYWTRVPLGATDRVEIVEGPTSSVYGNYAMGGVINVMTSAPASRHAEVKAQYGSLNSPQLDVTASDVFGKLGVVVNASAFDTEGYPTVVESERGVIDTNAAVNYQNVSVKAQYDVSSQMRAFVRAGYFREKRDNGKISTFDRSKEENDTSWTSINGGVNIHLRDRSELQASVSTDVETFHSNFLAVPAATPARSIGRMTLRQTVPTTGFGTAVQWSKAFSPKHLITTGFDARWVDGESQELGLDATSGLSVTLDRRSGGKQRSVGAFAQDLIALTDNLTVTLSGRVDSWRNYQGHNLETNIPSGTNTAGHNPSLADRSDTVFNPRAAVSYRVDDRVNVWGSYSTGFRAPTLNELYRQFRQGTTLTLANEQLGPEHLKGGELGVRVTPAANIIWRATYFENRIRDAVTNVTISSTPSLTTRKRLPLGLTRVAGIQTDVEYRPSSVLTLAAAYVYNTARVKESTVAPALVGLTLQQVPKNRGSVEIRYSDPKYVTLVFQVQGLGRQFDDDENARTVPGQASPGLPGYGVVGLSVSRQIGPNLDAFVNAQNLFDQQYFVGTLPTLVGSPRLVNVGVRLRLNGW
jgi:outer membrane receptor protein involved in Fe transport